MISKTLFTAKSAKVAKFKFFLSVLSELRGSIISVTTTIPDPLFRATTRQARDVQDISPAICPIPLRAQPNVTRLSIRRVF